MALVAFLLLGLAVPETPLTPVEILSWTPPPDVSRDFVPEGDGALGLLPPEAVCPGELREASWSRDGSRLLMVRHVPKIATLGKPPAPRGELLACTTASGRTVSFWRFDPDKTEIRDMKWMPGSETVALDTRWTENDGTKLRRTYLLDVPSGRSTTLYSGDTTLAGEMFVSPTHPLGFLQRSLPDGTFVVTLFSPRGQVGETTLARPKDGGVYNLATFDEAGTGLLVIRTRGEESAYLRVDPKTGAVREAERLARAPGESRYRGPRRLAYQALPASLGRPDQRGALLLHLGESGPALVVSADADGSPPPMQSRMGRIPKLSPQGDAVLYRHGGAGMVRRIVRLSASDLRRLEAAWDRYRAMRECAEASVALTSAAVRISPSTTIRVEEWLASNPAWPSNDAALSDRGNRFVRSSQSGGEFSTSVVGTVVGASGKAILYGSGLIEWRPA